MPPRRRGAGAGGRAGTTSRGGRPITGTRGSLLGHDRVHTPLEPSATSGFNTFHISPEKYKTLQIQSDFIPKEGTNEPTTFAGAFITLKYGISSGREKSEVGSDSAIDLRPPVENEESLHVVGDRAEAQSDPSENWNEEVLQTGPDKVLVLPQGESRIPEEALLVQKSTATEPEIGSFGASTYQILSPDRTRELGNTRLRDRPSEVTVPQSDNSQLSSVQFLDSSLPAEVEQQTPDHTKSTPKQKRPGSAQKATTRSASRRRELLLAQLALFQSPPAQPVIPPDPPTNMAPVKDPSHVPNTIKDIIQHLYDIQSQTHGFIPETQDLLVDKMTDLTQSLSQLQKLASTKESPNNPIHSIRIAPEIVDYVDDGRNPDIFTRDFVELVQRGNTVINGKQQAFKGFSQIFANALKEGISGIDKQVDQVMANSGLDESSQPQKRTESNGRNSQ